MTTSRPVSSLLVVLGCVASAQAAVSVPSFFSDHMVVQRDIPIAVWGRADPGEAVKVQLGEQSAVATTTASDGTWRVKLPATPAGGPFVLTVTGTNTVRINDVLVGEVWLCSGQSNMEWTVGSSLNPEQEKAAATDGQIRQLYVARRPASAPEATMNASWTVASPGTVGSFTACGYFMARELRKELGVPIGLINSSWGGTRIEPWTCLAGFASVPAFADLAKQLQQLDPKSPDYQKRAQEHLARIDAWAKQARESLGAGTAMDPTPETPAEIMPLAKRKDAHQQPTALYNGMIHPLVGYGMRGAIWYQGEANCGDAQTYPGKMQALVGGWRQAWGIGDFPFYFVQIAPYNYGGADPTMLPRFWMAQRSALSIPSTGMVVTNDIATYDDIHPRNKQEVGRRLALQALAKTYGKTALVADGPVFKAMTIDGATVRIAFDHAAGLASRDGKPLNWFELVGDEGDWTKADAIIDGETVVVSAAKIAKPLGVRFSWHGSADPNLVNGAKLPAAAFTAGCSYADQLPTIADAAAYRLIYDIDLTTLGSGITYASDASASAPAFDRVGYLLEIQRAGTPVRYAWASMDAFTTDASKLAIPTVANGAFFQVAVGNLTVASNQPGITTGSFASGGNIEIWPNNYVQANSAKVAGASDTAYDFGDQPTEPKDGYGCLQVHNAGAKETILALNNWKAGVNADVGLGTSTGETKDWTFAHNAAGAKVLRLRVFVRPKR